MNDGGGLVNHWFNALRSRIWQDTADVPDRGDSPCSRFGSFNLSDAPGTLPSGVFLLSTLQTGDRVRIVALNCGDSSNRLMGMGLIPGAVLEVISCTTTGSIIVALQDHRLGLSLETAQQIQVIPVDQSIDQSMDTVRGIDKDQSSNRNSAPITAKVTFMQTDSELSTVKLRDAAIGARLKVMGYEPTSRDYKRKLLAMGLTPGTELRVTRHAPLGDPTEIEVRNFHLSLRKAEADALIVTPISGEQS